MYLKQLKLVTNAARPSLEIVIEQSTIMEMQEGSLPYDFWNTGDVENTTRKRSRH